MVSFIKRLLGRSKVVGKHVVSQELIDKHGIDPVTAELYPREV